jgi:hypothetical protein
MKKKIIYLTIHTSYYNKKSKKKIKFFKNKSILKFKEIIRRNLLFR